MKTEPIDTARIELRQGGKTIAFYLASLPDDPAWYARRVDSEGRLRLVIDGVAALDDPHPRNQRAGEYGGEA